MRKSIYATILVAFGAQLLVAGAIPDHPLTLDEALNLLRTQNPALASGRSHLQAVAANEITANLRPNPIFLSANEDFNVFNASKLDPRRDQEFTQNVTQLLERGRKRASRLDSARWATRVTQDTFQDTQRQLEFSVKTAFVATLLAKSNLQFAQDNLRDYRETVRVNEIRLKAGDISPTEFQRIQVERASFERDVLDAQLALTQARVQLASLLGFREVPPGFDVAGELRPPEISTTLDDLQKSALDHRPDYLAARDGIDKAQADLRLARANAVTDVAIGSEYKRNNEDNTVGFTISFPIRIFDRNQGEIARTRYELEASQHGEVAARTAVSADVKQAYEAYNLAISRAKLYSQDELDRAKQVRDRMEFSYRHGGTTILDYLDALRRYREVELAQRSAYAQAMVSVHQLSLATGTEVQP